MKTLVIPLLLTLSVNSFADDIVKGEFSCKVRSIQITEMDEGKVKESSVSEDYSIGDILDLVYRIPSYDKEKLVVTLINGDELIFFTNYQNDGTLIKDKVYLKGANSLGEFNTYIFGFKDDFFKADGVATTIKLHRYYKSDWDGFYVSHTLGRTAVVGLDCRTKTDSYLKLKALTTK